MARACFAVGGMQATRGDTTPPWLAWARETLGTSKFTTVPQSTRTAHMIRGGIEGVPWLKRGDSVLETRGSLFVLVFRYLPLFIPPPRSFFALWWSDAGYSSAPWRRSHFSSCDVMRLTLLDVM